jgi:hypothetical protein
VAPGRHHHRATDPELAYVQTYVRFTGIACRAGVFPERGRSALELMNVETIFLREHTPSDCRIHYAILDGAPALAEGFTRRASWA